MRVRFRRYPHRPKERKKERKRERKKERVSHYENGIGYNVFLLYKG